MDSNGRYTKIFLKFQDRSKKRISIFIFICSIPTVYLAWNLPSIIDMFTKLQKWTDIFMYISFYFAIDTDHRIILRCLHCL